MKKIFVLSLILLGLGWSCAENESLETPSLKLSTTTLNFAIDPTKEGAIAVTSNVEWIANVEPGCSWCIISSQSGIGDAVINVTATKNIACENRKTTITITGRNVEPQLVVVNQLGSSPEILIDNSLHEINEADSSLQIKITTNIEDIDVLIPETIKWISLQNVSMSAQEKTILVNFKIDRNPTFDARNAAVTINGQGVNISKTIEIKQKGQRKPSLVFVNASFDENSLLAPIARKISFSVDANVDYTMSVEATGNWLTQFSKENNNYVFNVSENTTLSERIGRIIIKQQGGVLSDTLSIRQDIYSELIKIVNSNFDESKGISALATKISFTVEANVAYSVSVKTDAGNWVREVSNSGGMYSFTVDANLSSKRTALIIAKQEGGAIADTLILVQDEVNKRYSDSLALVAIYHALDMANWSKTSVNANNKNRPWAFELEKPMDQWGGIRLNSEGRVIRWQVFESGKDKLHSNPNFRFHIPAEVAQLTELRLMQIVTYNFGGFAPEIGNLSKLDTLAFSGDLSGTLPSSIVNLTALKYLQISNIDMELRCQLTGTIPATIGNLTNLLSFSINRTMISGSIPASIGDLSKLKVLSLAANQLDGAIPTGLGKLSELETCLLFSNGLTGSIPADFDNLKKIKSLMLMENYLTGTISDYLKGKQLVDPTNFIYCPQNGSGFSNFTCN